MMLSAQPAPTMRDHDELAELFSRNLVLNPQLAAYNQPPEQLQQRAQYEGLNQFGNPGALSNAAQPTAAPITYSISQHYHHSTHTAHQQQLEQQTPRRRASEPPHSEPEACEAMLRANGINPNILSPSQAQLFIVAGPDQRARLVELWRICPPSNTAEDDSPSWTSTTMDREEQLVRMRYAQESSMDLNYDSLQSVDGRWTDYVNDSAEPYMQTGYEELRDRENLQKTQMHVENAPPRFGLAGKGSWGSQPTCAYSRATDPIYGVENRHYM